jgi:hypothetical protein
MSRTAQARLQVQVDDAALDTHVTKVKTTQSAWGDLKKDLIDVAQTDFKSATAGMGDMAKHLESIVRSVKGTKGGLGTSFNQIGDAAKNAAPHVAAIATSAQNLAPAAEAVAIKVREWAKAQNALNRSLDTTHDRAESLIKQQGALDAHFNKFGVQMASFNAALKSQGQQLLQVVQAFAAFNKATQQAAKNQKAAAEESKGFWSTLASAERTFIRHATTMFIFGQWITEIHEGMRSAAQLADLNNTLGKSVDGFTQKMQDAQEATKGTVTELELAKNLALMSSFDIPIDKFAQNMGLIQKLSIRTGQDATFLMESFSRGISRLSPAILDNLGLQVSLKQAYEAFAASVGKSTDALTSQEKKMAVMNEVIRQAKDLTKDVDPATSLQARLDRMTSKISDFFTNLKKDILEGLTYAFADAADRAGIMADKTAIALKNLREMGKVGKKDNGVVGNESFNAMAGWAQNMVVSDFMKDRNAIDFFTKQKLKDMYDLKVLAELTLPELEAVQAAHKREADMYNVAATAAERARDMRIEAARAYAEFRKAQAEGEDTNSEDMQELWASYAVNSTGESSYQKFAERGLSELKLVEKAFDDVKEKAKQFQDTASQGAYLQQMNDKLEHWRAEIVRVFNQDLSVDAMREALGPYMDGWGGDWADTAKVIADFDKETVDSVQKTSAEFKKRNAEQRKLIDGATNLVQTERDYLSMLSGQNELQIEYGKLKSNAEEQEKEFLRMRKESQVLDVENGKYTVAQVEAQAKIAVDALQQLQALEKKVELDKQVTRYMTETSFLSKQAQEAEAKALANGLSRLQVEKKFLENREAVKLMTVQLALAEASLAIAIGAGDKVMEAVATGQINGYKAIIEQLKKDLVFYGNALERFPKGGGSDKKKKDDYVKWKGAEHEDMGFARIGVERIDDTIHAWQETFVQRWDKASNQWLEPELAKRAKQTFKVLSKIDYGDDTKSNAGLGGKAFMNLFGMGDTMMGEDVEGMIEKNKESIKAITAMMTEENMPILQQYIDQLYAANRPLEDHMRLMNELSTVIGDIGIGIENAFGGGADLIGEDWLNSLDALGTSLGKISQGLAENASGYDLVSAAMPAMRTFTKEFIKDQRARAGVEALMNMAAAWAAWGNWPKVAAHATAAVMYGAVAGGIGLKLPSKQAKDEKDAASYSGAPIHLHLYGEMVMTEGERGAMMDRAVQLARAEGRTS